MSKNLLRLRAPPQTPLRELKGPTIRSTRGEVNISTFLNVLPKIKQFSGSATVSEIIAYIDNYSSNTDE